MAFDLSFSPEFFFAEGEPEDRGDLALNDQGQPVSVWSALDAMPRRRWDQMARAVFGVSGESLTTRTVLDRIRETNTCGTLTPPVDVWIDAAGDYRVHVHDTRGGR